MVGAKLGNAALGSLIFRTAMGATLDILSDSDDHKGITSSLLSSIQNTRSSSEYVSHPLRSADNMTAVTMTSYMSNFDPGGQGANLAEYGAGLGVDGSVWLQQCHSNSSVMWMLTSPVCSTKFTSFVLFVAVTIVLTIITLWTILGNVLVLCALYRYRSLRTMSNCLIGNLAVSDLLLAITVLPISTANDLLGYWVFGSTMCTIWLSIDVLYCTASIWGLCTIAFDRYTATVYPMWYHDKRSTKKALAYMLFVWIFSIIISLAPFIGWQDMISGFYIYEPTINRYLCILFSSKSYVIYSAMGSFILPSCVMTFLYVQIFVVLHSQGDILKKSSLTSETPSPMANGCPTIAISSTQDSGCAVTRDPTASTFTAEDTFVAKDEEVVEKETKEEDEEQADSPSPTQTDFELGGSDIERRNSSTPVHNGQDELKTALLRDQRSNSLNVEMETFRSESFLSQPKKDFLTVSTCDIPFQFKMKKSRSTAFSLQENGANCSRADSTVPRSKSVTMLSSRQMSNMENSNKTVSSLSLHRFSLPWLNKRRNPMTTSMRRRFQLREQRATKRMLLIMACFFVCWVPFTLMYMLRSLCPHCQQLDDHVVAFIIWLGYANSSLNPLLYTLFNEDFRKAFKKLLGIGRRRRPPRQQ